MDPLLMELIQRAMSPGVDENNYPPPLDPQLLEILQMVGGSMGMAPQNPMMDMMGGINGDFAGAGLLQPNDPSLMGDPMMDSMAMGAGMGMGMSGAMPEPFPQQGPLPMEMPMAQPSVPGAMMPPISTVMPSQPGQEPNPELLNQLMQRGMKQQGPPMEEGEEEFEDEDSGGVPF